MKDFTVKGDKPSRFITDVIFEREDNTYTIQFADGSSFTGIEATEDNLDIIKRQMEVQATKGLRHLKKFQGYKTLLGILYGADVITCLTTLASLIATNQSMNSGMNPENVLSSAVIIAGTFVAAFPFGIGFHKEKGKVEELKKIRYRNNYLPTLEKFDQYPNSLEGIGKSARYTLLHDDDPFSVINMDYYETSDLETIVDNVEKESSYQFTYKKPNPNQK